MDLGAEQMLAADKEGKKIAIEIKSFLKESFISEFYEVLGQFLHYRLALKEKHPQRLLFLAVPDEIYKTHFQLKFVQTIIKAYRLKYLVYDIETEEIIKWKK